MSRSRAWKLIAFAPILLVLYANFMFVRNHFYANGPYLHDSGWFSGIVYRAGIVPRNPPTSEMPYFWGWHITLIISLGSILSYLFPGDRVDWYCIFQAAIYAPLALAMPLLVPPSERNGLRSALLVAACSVAFAFSGQVLTCIAYPHFEIFASAGIAIMLGALAMGRERLAWVGLAMAIGTREDCGYHAASLLVAVVAADFLGRPFPIARRRVLLMAGVGLVSTALMMFLQKRLLFTVDAFRIYITGSPAYAHLTGPAIVERLSDFGTKCGFIWVPILASALVAVARRDARYLLGWVVTMPWLLVNLTAIQPAKASISVYTGFPFIGSAFWIAAYGRVGEAREPHRRWYWPLVSGAFVSVASFLGLLFSFQSQATGLLQDCVIPSTRNPEGVRAFARGLRTREYGAVKVDHAMTAWALEGARPADYLSARDAKEGIHSADGFAFFLNGDSVALLAWSALPKCGRVPDTKFIFCTMADRSLPGTVTPTTGLLLELEQIAAQHVRREGEAIVGEARAEGGIAVFGPYMRLAPGSYLATWTMKQGQCVGTSPRPIHVDVLAGGNRLLAERDVAAEGNVTELAFEITPDHADDAVELRTSFGSCAFTLRGLALKRVAVAPEEPRAPLPVPQP